MSKEEEVVFDWDTDRRVFQPDDDLSNKEVYDDLIVGYDHFKQVIKEKFELKKIKNITEKSTLFINIKSLIEFYRDKKRNLSRKRKRDGDGIYEVYTARITELTKNIRNAKDRLNYHCKSAVVLLFQGIL